MRHSFRPFQPQPRRPTSSEAATAASSKPADKAASEAFVADNRVYSPTGMTGSQATGSSSSDQSSHSHSADGLGHGINLGQTTQSMHAVPAASRTVSKPVGDGMMNGTSNSSRDGPAVHLRVSTGQQPPLMAEPSTYASSTTSVTSTDDLAELQSRRLSGDGASTSGQSTVSGWHPHDPEHLIVNGLGGAFLHPTHVFSPSRFVSGMSACSGCCVSSCCLVPVCHVGLSCAAGSCLLFVNAIHTMHVSVFLLHD